VNGLIEKRIEELGCCWDMLLGGDVVVVVVVVACVVAYEK
jgi:hypothetical protein